MSQVAPVWQKRQVSPEVIQKWRDAVEDGRRKYYDLERRATYPCNADEDSVALAEHYRLRYPHARMLKALSYYMDVSPDDLTAVTGIHKALLTMEVGRLSTRVKMRIASLRGPASEIMFYRLTDTADCDEIRMVIHNSWHL